MMRVMFTPPLVFMMYCLQIKSQETLNVLFVQLQSYPLSLSFPFTNRLINSVKKQVGCWLGGGEVWGSGWGLVLAWTLFVHGGLKGS